MTVRGGGIPTCPLAFVPIGRMGPPLRSFAADAHDCIMVRVLGPTGYKVVARLIAPASGLPSDRHSDCGKRAVVLEAARLVRRQMCHVWTAPSWQGLSSRCRVSRCGHVFGLT